MALCHAGKAGDHHEIAFAQRLVGDLEPGLGLVGHVLLGIGHGRAIGRDIGAVEAEIAGMARPLPVVGLAAEIADAARRSIDQPHVLDLELLLQEIGLPTEIGTDVAAAIGLLLAFGDQRLAVGLQPVVAIKTRKLGGDALVHRRGHVAQVLDHIDARSRRGGQFVALGLGQKAIGQIVLPRLGIILDRAIDAVMVGGDQPLGADERGGAAAQRNNGIERRGLEIAKVRRRQLQPGRFQLVAQRRRLSRQPHALFGKHGGGYQQGGRGKQQGITHQRTPQTGARGWHGRSDRPQP